MPTSWEAEIAKLVKRIELDNICDQNKTILLKFKKYMEGEDLSPSRIYKHLYNAYRFATIINKPFTQWDEEDVIYALAEVYKIVKSEYTKKDNRVTVKKLFKWLKRDEVVKNVSTALKNKRKLLPQDLLTKKEIEAMIDAANNTRDKMAIALLYETGMRPTEFLCLEHRHILFDNFGAVVNVPSEGKTGPRPLRVVPSAPLLSAWFAESHLLRPERPYQRVYHAISKNRFGKPVSLDKFRERLKKIAEEAGIKKRVYPYLFRHTRATELAKFLTEAEMCLWFGWELGSDMPKIYVHLAGRDVEDKILKLHGIKRDDDRLDSFLMKECPRCGTRNVTGSRYCSRCGMLLDEKTAVLATVGEKDITKEWLEEIIEQILSKKFTQSHA